MDNFYSSRDSLNFEEHLDDLTNENFNFYLYFAAFFVLNLICDQLLGLFRSYLPYPILKYNEQYKSDENLKLLPSNNASKGINPFRLNIFLSTTTKDLLRKSIENGHSIGEWKINFISLKQSLIIGLSTSIIFSLHPYLLITNPFEPLNYHLNTLIPLNSLKAGYLLYKVLIVAIRYIGDNSIGLILNNSIQLLFIITATLYRSSILSYHRYTRFIAFGYLLDNQSIFHYFKRALIFIELSNSPPHSICNAFSFILIVSLRPFVHYHQLNWLYKLFQEPGFKLDYLWFIACLATALQILDTVFLLFDHLMTIRRSLKKFNAQTKILASKESIFNKTRKLDSDTEILLYF